MSRGLFRWVVVKDAEADGTPSGEQIAEGTASCRPEATGAAYAAVRDAALAAGTQDFGYRHQDQENGGYTGHHTLDDGTKLRVLVTPGP